MEEIRIKTEEEFLLEFGPGWRHEVDSQFPRGMDHLLGLNVIEDLSTSTFKYAIDVINGDRRSFDVDGYNISLDMLIWKETPKFKNGIAILNNGLYAK